MFRGLSVFGFLIFYILQLSGQTVPAPVPCTSPPSGPGCECSTAGILCTPDLFDGFTFSMSNSVNYGGFGAGNDLCPGIGNQDGVPNNVNWFSFIAWCTDLEFDVYITNCSAGTQGGGAPSYGVQMGLFGACPIGNPLECITEGANLCSGSPTGFTSPRTFSVTGLTIGNTYYFMMDGCKGSACDITIDVIGSCGTGLIDPWTTGVTGPLTTCVGNTDTYTAEDLNGAVEFYYYLDGTLIDDGTELLSTDITWTTAGTYELCVDVSNLPCIPESDDPLPYCITIMVCEEADAGTISINTSPACPGEVIDFSVSGYTNDADHDQYLIITDASGTIIEVILGDTGDFTHDECETFKLFSYNVKIGSPVPTVGTVFPDDYPCLDNCCDYEEEELEFEDTVPPVFTNPPGDITYSCYADLPAMVDLDWTDDCMGAGLQSGKETGSADLCNGGSIMREWEVVDSCDNTAIHTQNITIDPIPTAMYVNPPGDMTVDCDAIPTSAPDLMYSNGGSGSCDINGTVPATVNGTADLCGGTITNEWMITDACGRILEHTQTITVNPVPPATFTNPPADMTVQCDAIPTSAPDLAYTNGETGACEIAGMVPAVMSGSGDQCGGTITFTWEFIDVCGRPITHTQNITIDPIPQASFINPPADMTVQCDAIPTSAPDLAYTNGETGVCEIAGMVPAVMSGSGDICGGTIQYMWEFIDVCGRPISHTQTITIVPIPEAMFVNPPADMTVACAAIPAPASDLNYTNGETGVCEIMGAISPTIVDNSSACGGTIVNTWEFMDMCNRPIMHTQTITINPAPQAEYVNPPADITVDCDAIPTSAPDLLLTNGETGVCMIEATVSPTLSGTPSPCGGTIQYIWTHTDDCSRTTTYTQSISITPSAPPVFDPTPADITVNCNAIPASGIPLSYSNGQSGVCGISGVVLSTRTGVANECGGNILDSWNFTDQCGRTISAFRTITVLPAPEAAFINPPSDVTVECVDISSVSLIASYSNGESGDCEIEGDVTAIVSNNYDVCGGTITHTWTFTDACNRTILHNRTVTINPAPEPMFVNPPADLTVNCGETYDPPFTLEITNGLTGECEITDQAMLISTWNGNIMMNEWFYTSPCTGVTYTHYQDVLTLTQPDISINPTFGNLCEGETYDLSTITVTDANNTFPTYTFHYASPPTNFNEIDPLVEPIGVSLYYINATNSDGCEDVAEFIIYTVEPYLAGEDIDVELCKDGSTLNLNSYLGSDASEEGFWFDLNMTGIDVSNPDVVNINNINPGVYLLYYITDENEVCPGDTAVLTLNITDDVDYQISDISCSIDNTTYSITITTNGNTVMTTAGILSVVDANTVEIDDIPIGTQVTLTIESSSSDCSVERIVNSPNCNCPDIPAPIGVPTYKICATAVPLTMEVMVEAGLTANWYDSQAGLVPLQMESLTFNHNNATPGIYTYYVESIDLITSCVSQERFKIEVEVVSKPSFNNVNPKLCDDDDDGFQFFNLVNIGSTINGNPNNNIQFYLNIADANAESNPLVSPYKNIAPNQVIYAVIKNATGCKSLAEVTLTVLPLPIFDLQISDESCLSNKDGALVVNNISSTGNIMTSLNNGPFQPNTTFNNLTVGTYQLVVRDSVSCAVDTSFEVKEGLQILTNTFEVVCDNKGTLSDATDDEYLMSFNFQNNQNNQGEYILFIDNVEIGRYSYDQLQNLSLGADGTNKMIVIEDVSNGCQLTRSIGPLNPCSTTCVLTIEDIVYTCNNAGTDDNPGDDFYNVSVLVSSINGSAGNTYNVLVDGVIRGVGNYNVNYDFNVNASQNDIVITIQDSDDSQCQTNYTLVDLIPCSDGCLVSLTLLSQVCDNNGTILEKDDDFYTITFTTRGINTGSSTYKLLIDGVEDNIYTYGDTITIVLPADGVLHVLGAEDVTRSDCNDEQNTRILTNCSTDCEIVVDPANISCNNNGTNDIENDDTYTFDLTISGGKGTEWSIEELSESGTYGSTVQFGPFNISDGPIDITVVDGDIAECTTTITINPPSPCSGCVQSLNVSANGIINCSNPEVPLVATVSENGTYLWTFQGGVVSNDLTGNAGSEGYYVFNVVFSDGCTLTDSVFVESDDDIPVANAGADKVLNCETDSVRLNGQLSSQGPDYAYEWTNSNGVVIGTGIDLWVSTPGDYFLQVFDTNFNCASAKEKVVVTEYNDIPSTAIYANPGDQFDCIIAEIILTTDKEQDVTYSWVTSETIFDDVDSLIVTQIGEYILIATNTKSLCVDTGRIEILSFQEYPIINLNVDEDLDCDTESVIISADGSQEAPSIVYNWYNLEGELISQTEGELSVQDPGYYVLVLEDEENGCTNSDTIEVISIETEVGIDIDAFIEVIQGETVILRPIVNIPQNEIASIIWDPTDGLSCTDCLEPRVLIDEDISYTVTITDIYGCEGSATINIRTRIKSVITVPNVIFPGSGVGNDKFIIQTNDDLAVINKVVIFDRWGNKVFSSSSVTPNSPDGAWNGKFNGKDVNPGVFVYLIEGVLGTGEVISLSGDLTVMR